MENTFIGEELPKFDDRMSNLPEKVIDSAVQLQFHGVCKIWRLIRMIEILTVKRLPCAARFSCVGDGNGGVISECLISLPTEQSTIPVFHKIDRDDKHKFVGAKGC